MLLQLLHSDQNNINVATLNFDENTLPATTIASVQAFINPRAVFPGRVYQRVHWLAARYIITQDIIPGAVAWGSFYAKANDIIEFNGTEWTVTSAFETLTVGVIVKNLTSGKLYASITTGWVLAVEGLYNARFWRVNFFADYANQGV